MNTPTPTPTPSAGTEEPAAIIQLLDGGRLVVHDMNGGKPTVFTMPFQVCVCVCVCECIRVRACVHVGTRVCV
jgi:hypothetical protein